MRARWVEIAAEAGSLSGQSGGRAATTSAGTGSRASRRCRRGRQVATFLLRRGEGVGEKDEGAAVAQQNKDGPGWPQQDVHQQKRGEVPTSHQHFEYIMSFLKGK